MENKKTLDIRAGYSNRHIDGMPEAKCVIEVVKNDIDGEHLYKCIWEPYDESSYGVIKPYEGFMCSAKVISRPIQIGFNVWEQNDSEFVYYKVISKGVADKGVFKYRSHRGSLDESMKTMKEYSEVDELVKDLYNDLGGEVLEITTSYCRYDERVDWDTYYVLVKRVGDERYIVEGMSNSPISYQMKLAN